VPHSYDKYDEGFLAPGCRLMRRNTPLLIHARVALQRCRFMRLVRADGSNCRQTAAAALLWLIMYNRRHE
jgi:hypothetical protein